MSIRWEGWVQDENRIRMRTGWERWVQDEKNEHWKKKNEKDKYRMRRMSTRSK